MQPHWPINLKNGLKVNVPADLDNPVTLTLLEYEDWPEPEFAFLRQLVQPGLRILDATAFDLIRLGASTPLDPAGCNRPTRCSCCPATAPPHARNSR